MTPLTTEEEPTTDSIPRPTIGRPVKIHVDTPEKPTPGGKKGSPEHPTTPDTPPTATTQVTEDQYYNYEDEDSDVDVKVNVNVGPNGATVGGKVVVEESTDSTGKEYSYYKICFDD